MQKKNYFFFVCYRGSELCVRQISPHVRAHKRFSIIIIDQPTCFQAFSSYFLLNVACCPTLFLEICLTLTVKFCSWTSLSIAIQKVQKNYILTFCLVWNFRNAPLNVESIVYKKNILFWNLLISWIKFKFESILYLAKDGLHFAVYWLFPNIFQIRPSKQKKNKEQQSQLTVKSCQSTSIFGVHKVIEILFVINACIKNEDNIVFDQIS